MKRPGSILLALVALVWLLVSGLGFFFVPFYGFALSSWPEPRVRLLSEDTLVREGERVLRVNGRPLNDPQELNRILYEVPPGTPLSIEVLTAPAAGWRWCSLESRPPCASWRPRRPRSSPAWSCSRSG